MKTNLVKIVRTGNGLKERTHVKTFVSHEEACAFQCKQFDNDWRLAPADLANVKAGVYAFAGGKWHNVKSLDPSVLAHI
jgi:hypothetical protein